jgi:acrylyl-CoA reductase (NADPH)
MADQSTFRALVLREDDGKIAAAIETLDNAELPDGDVTVRVSHSTLNYKDGMVLGGIGRLVRNYPHVPGIDFAGVVEASDAPGFAPGDRVVLTGWRVGEAHWGGYAERARVKSDWLVKLPDGLSEYQAMALGTAGFTAMLAITELEGAGLSPDRGEVLVTGANGGVGGVALALLAALGYSVAASTGRPEASDHLRALGAETIIDRAELAAVPDRPLLKERWVGTVDAVGGATLANVLTQTAYGGAVAACGLAGGNKLDTTVIPFLLRGVKLLGIDSVMCPRDRREAAWARLAREMPADALDRLSHTVPLSELAALGPEILQGRTQGRIVVDVEA